MKKYNRKKDVIELNNNWSIIGQEHSWELRHKVEKTRKKLDKNRKETGETEKYTDYDKWWHPKIKMSLRRYLEESLKPLDSVKKLEEKLGQVQKEIESIKQ